MKIWCSLNRNPANKWSESCALWSSFPVAYVSKIFFGETPVKKEALISTAELTYR
jgi:hypothetical protein